MNELTFSQLQEELKIICKRTGKYPEIMYLTPEEWKHFTSLFQQNEKVIKAGIIGEGMSFAEIPLERKPK